MNWKEIIIWIIVFIIGSLVVTFLVSPNSFQSFKSNIKSIIPSNSNIDKQTSSKSQETIVSYCIQEFNKYTGIAEQKYNHLSYSMIEVEKMSSDEEAGEFWDLYKSPLDFSYSTQKTVYSSWNFTYPIVMIAGKLIINDGSLPFVVYCDSDGKLSENSKKILNP